MAEQTKDQRIRDLTTPRIRELELTLLQAVAAGVAMLLEDNCIHQQNLPGMPQNIHARRRTSDALLEEALQ